MVRGWSSGGRGASMSSGVEFLPCRVLQMRGGNCSGELGWCPASLSLSTPFAAPTLAVLFPQGALSPSPRWASRALVSPLT